MPQGDQPVAARGPNLPVEVGRVYLFPVKNSNRKEAWTIQGVDPRTKALIFGKPSKGKAGKQDTLQTRLITVDALRTSGATAGGIAFNPFSNQPFSYANGSAQAQGFDAAKNQVLLSGFENGERFSRWVDVRTANALRDKTLTSINGEKPSEKTQAVPPATANEEVEADTGTQATPEPTEATGASSFAEEAYTPSGSSLVQTIGAPLPTTLSAVAPESRPIERTRPELTQTAPDLTDETTEESLSEGTVEETAAEEPNVTTSPASSPTASSVGPAILRRAGRASRLSRTAVASGGLAAAIPTAPQLETISVQTAPASSDSTGDVSATITGGGTVEVQATGAPSASVATPNVDVTATVTGSTPVETIAPTISAQLELMRQQQAERLQAGPVAQVTAPIPAAGASAPQNQGSAPLSASRKEAVIRDLQNSIQQQTEERDRLIQERDGLSKQLAQMEQQRAQALLGSDRTAPNQLLQAQRPLQSRRDQIQTLIGLANQNLALEQARLNELGGGTSGRAPVAAGRISVGAPRTSGRTAGGQNATQDTTAAAIAQRITKRPTLPSQPGALLDSLKQQARVQGLESGAGGDSSLSDSYSQAFENEGGQGSVLDIPSKSYTTSASPTLGAFEGLEGEVAAGQPGYEPSESEKSREFMKRQRGLRETGQQFSGAPTVGAVEVSVEAPAEGSEAIPEEIEPLTQAEAGQIVLAQQAQDRAAAIGELGAAAVGANEEEEEDEDEDESKADIRSADQMTKLRTYGEDARKFSMGIGELFALNPIDLFMLLVSLNLRLIYTKWPSDSLASAIKTIDGKWDKMGSTNNRDLRLGPTMKKVVPMLDLGFILLMFVLLFAIIAGLTIIYTLVNGPPSGGITSGIPALGTGVQSAPRVGGR